MRIMACFLLLMLTSSLAAQEKSKWRRVYTYDDAIVEMEEIKMTFGDFGRVRFRTVYDKPETLGGTPPVKYKSDIEDIEFQCEGAEYRVIQQDFLDSKGKVIRSYKADSSAHWKEVRTGMMRIFFNAACNMIREKKV